MDRAESASARLPRLIFVSGWAHPPSWLSSLGAALTGRIDATILSADPSAQALGVPSSATEGRRARAVPPLLAGWSLGAMLALREALARPEGLGGLLLIAGTPRFTAGEGFPHGLEEASVRAMALGFRREPAGTLERFYRDVALPLSPLRDPRALATEVVSDPSAPESLRRGLEHLRREDLRDRCRALPFPCRVLHGREDRIVPVEAGAWLARSLGASLGIVEGTGHDLPLREPERILAAALGLLEEARRP
jgi:pimeloyl-[acyl-carrier protein] methyl ester esterase